MTDRELLEMAAKAAGLMTHRYCEAWSAMAKYTLQDGYFGSPWNPLTDDGDALRLAVKADIQIVPGEEGDPYAVATWWVRPNRIEQDFERVLVNGDRAAAVRRAIVQAAAEIEKAVEQKPAQE